MTPFKPLDSGLHVPGHVQELHNAKVQDELNEHVRKLQERISLFIKNCTSKVLPEVVVELMDDPTSAKYTAQTTQMLSELGFTVRQIVQANGSDMDVVFQKVSRDPANPTVIIGILEIRYQPEKVIINQKENRNASEYAVVTSHPIVRRWLRLLGKDNERAKAAYDTSLQQGTIHDCAAPTASTVDLGDAVSAKLTNTGSSAV